MNARGAIAATAMLMSLGFAGPALADFAASACSEVNVTYSQTYPASYCLFPGQPKDYVTIAPDGKGETLAGTGITIEVIVRNASCIPLAGIPAAQIVLFSPNLTICAGGSRADNETDVNGRTTFTGSLAGGGCTQGLGMDVYVDGIWVGHADVNINSADFADKGTSPGFIDSSDLALFASVFGKSCSEIGPDFICFDFNEIGSSIDASDLAFFASVLGRACP